MLDSKYFPTIPQRTIDTIDNYVLHGLEPGGFVTAVLCNDLAGAVGTADRENLAALPDIVKYVYNECPSDCWGNQNKVNAYFKKIRNKQSNSQPDAQEA